MEFDLQRFTEDGETFVEPETSAETSPEEQAPIPEELDGIPDHIARETMEEWEQSQAESEPAPPAEPQTVSREEYQAQAAEIEKLKAQLAQYQQQQPVQKPQKPQPQFKITPEYSTKINEAINAEAMALTGFSQDDVDSLDWADEDDPRLAQWNQAKSLAQMSVLEAVRKGRIAQAQQQQQAQSNYLAATQIYNEFAQKEFKEPDFKDIQHFATNEFFEQLDPRMQRIVANSYLRVEQQTASPAEMLAVKNYYEQAKAAFRSRSGRKTAPTAYRRAQQAATLPRSDQLRGGTSKGELSAAELEHMLDTMPFEKIPEPYQLKLLGY